MKFSAELSALWLELFYSEFRMGMCVLLSSKFRHTFHAFHLHSLGVFAAELGWVRLPWQEWTPALKVKLCPECLPCIASLVCFWVKVVFKISLNLSVKTPLRCKVEYGKRIQHEIIIFKCRLVLIFILIL